ncbi:MAG TPA: glycosyltransferase family 39 protein, partial [Candidatus Eisenbacteria bacterium]
MRAPHEGDRLAATAAPPARTALPWSLLLVLAVALLLRLGFDAARSRPPVSDQADYDRIAWTLATHGTYQDDGRPTAFRLPGYVAFIGAIYRVVGRHPGAVYAVQAALDVGTALLLFVLLRRRSARAAWIGAVLWALLPAAIAYSGLLLSETLFAFLLVVLAAKLDRGESRSALDRFATGLLVGALILVKTPALFLLAALLLAAVAAGVGRRSIPLVAGALLVTAPWFARNVVVLGVPTLTTSIGS